MGLDEDIRRIADEQQVRNLLARMGHLADDGELDEYMDQFTEDAVWDGGPVFGRRQGQEAILEGARERRASGTSGPGAHTRHVLTTTEVQVNGDTARSKSVFMFYVGIDAEPKVQVVGVYEDECRRTPQGWKLAHRKIINP